MELNYTKHNILLGASGELFIKRIFHNLGFNIANHNLTDGGVDIDGYNEYNKRVVAEVLCWSKGFVNTSRFDSIVRNLVTTRADYKFLFAIGAKLDKQQKKLLHGYNIHLIILPPLRTITKRIFVKLIKNISGVIDLYLFSNCSVVFTNREVYPTMFYAFKLLFADEDKANQLAFILEFKLNVRGDSVNEKLNK